MNDDSSITTWIQRVKSGDADAAQRIWERYVARLVAVARVKLQSSNRRAADENDVVQEAFEAFFRAARTARLTLLSDRHDLWQILVKITENKAFDQLKHAARRKRGSGDVRGDSAMRAINGVRSGDNSKGAGGFDRLAGAEPDPVLVVAALEQFRCLLDLLDDPQLRRIAIGKMEGRSHEELARIENCVPDTIGRKLNLIRKTWKEAGF